jgi:hypothetical protein
MTPEEFEGLQQESQERYVRALPTMGLWGGNPVPRGEVRGSYRIMIESPMGMPIMHGTFGSLESLDGPGLIEDLRYRIRGIPERIFSKGD